MLSDELETSAWIGPDHWRPCETLRWFDAIVDERRYGEMGAAEMATESSIRRIAENESASRQVNKAARGRASGRKRRCEVANAPVANAVQAAAGTTVLMS